MDGRLKFVNPLIALRSYPHLLAKRNGKAAAVVNAALAGSGAVVMGPDANPN